VITLDDLRQENARLAAEKAAWLIEKATLSTTTEQLNARVLELLVEIETWKRRLFGQKAERVRHSEAQTSLLELLEQMGRLKQGDLDTAEVAELAEVADELLDDLRDEANEDKEGKGKKSEAKKAKKGGTKGRRNLDVTDLPAHRIVIYPVGITVGDEQFVKVGEEVSRHIDYQPHSHVVIEIIRPKFIEASKASSPASSVTSSEPAVKFLVADAPELPISKGLAGPGLIANVVVRKYADHLPLHRQERIFQRDGVPFSRSTLCRWVQGATKLLAHITEAMWAESKTAPLLLTDACGVLIREKERCRRGHFQVFIDPGRHINFRFLPNSDGDAVAAELQGFRGMLQADAAATYHESLRQNPDIVEVGCWAHARRNFFEALGVDRGRALVGIGFISTLYDAHRKAHDEHGILNAAKRKALATPILDSMLVWINAERPGLRRPSTIERAMGYIERHWKPLTRFLDDGRLRLDNNPSELELRHQVVGRKNWLFCATDGGATWNSIAVSLIASCRIHKVEPWAYLRDVLTLLPAWSQTRALELAPANWQKTREQPEARKHLEDRRFLGRGVPHPADDDPEPPSSPNGVE